MFLLACPERLEFFMSKARGFVILSKKRGDVCMGSFSIWHWLAILLITPVIPAVIAKNKGRSAFGFWLYGLLLFPVALVHSLVMKNENKTKAEN